MRGNSCQPFVAVWLFSFMIAELRGPLCLATLQTCIKRCALSQGAYSLNRQHNKGWEQEALSPFYIRGAEAHRHFSDLPKVTQESRVECKIPEYLSDTFFILDSDCSGFTSEESKYFRIHSIQTPYSHHPRGRMRGYVCFPSS